LPPRPRTNQGVLQLQDGIAIKQQQRTNFAV